MMNSYTILEAVGEVNDRYITTLLEEKPCQRKLMSGRSMRWIAAAACICLIIGGLIYMHVKGEQPTLGFSITAYAKNPNGEGYVEKTLTLSERVPVDAIFSDNGQALFSFSFPAEDPDAPSHSVVYIAGNMQRNYIPLENMAKFNGIWKTRGNVYVYYYPDLKKQPPYKLSIELGSFKSHEDISNLKTAELLITETDGQYYAELIEIKKAEIATMPYYYEYEGGFAASIEPNPIYESMAAEWQEKKQQLETKEVTDLLRKWIAPYLAVNEKLKEECGDIYGIELSLTEENYWNFYEENKDKTPSEYEAYMRKSLEDEFGLNQK